MHDSDERYPPPMRHPETREIIIVRIKDWYGFQIRPDRPIMWVHAPAGYGKTAIAGTISKLLEEVEGLDFSPLGATFYFWRTSPERNSPARFIISIAYQLAWHRLRRYRARAASMYHTRALDGRREC
ncbi:hypothetical protein H1R20_g677, partial [Candolleomyces eurysporus]